MTEKDTEGVNRPVRLIDVFLQFTVYNRQNFAIHDQQTLDSRHFLTLKRKWQRVYNRRFFALLAI